MPLETASTIDALNVNNPTATDGLSQGDDHLRLIKTSLHGTFPNFTGAGVASTEAQLDAGATVASTGAAKLADAGAFFATNATDGITNPAAGEVDVEAGAQIVAKFKSDKSAAFQGAVSSVTGFTGAGTMPVGGTMIWWEDTLPDASWGTYAWANGQVITSADTVCPALLARWGTTFGGNGTTTMGVPDLRDSVPLGKGTMGGASAAGRVTNFTTTVLGALVGACNYVLTQVNLPSIHLNVDIPAGQGAHFHTLNDGNIVVNNGGGLGFVNGTNASSTNIVTNGAVLPEMTGSADLGGQNTPVNTVQPSTICNYVIRIA